MKRAGPRASRMKRQLGAAACAVWVLAATGCRTAAPPARADPEIERLSRVARAAFQMGAVEKAVLLYEKALLRAKATDDTRQIAHNAYNLAACFISLREFDKATLLLKEAAIEFARAGTDGAEVTFLRAKVARLTGQEEQAQTLAQEALAGSDPARNPAFALQVRLLMADLACDRGDSAAARAELDATEKLRRKVSEPGVLARYHAVAAHLAVVMTAWREAAAHFDTAAEFLRRVGNHREMIEALQAAAEAYEKAPENTLAADRLFRAARCLYAGARLQDAQEVITRLQPIADRINDADLREQIAALARQVADALKEEEKKEAAEKRHADPIVRRFR
ncbi:MAG: hypothetical protein JXR37_24655 [Kiritimatiellae bacterium]|nr:hypothetical protein [Kiritimatiellia bacterium]